MKSGIKRNLGKIYWSGQTLFIKTLLPICSLSLLRNTFDRTILLPFYHLVSDNHDIPHVKHLYTYPSEKKFQEDMQFFLQNYTPITLKDLMDHTLKGSSIPPRSFLLSFDDGFRESIGIIAPILKKLGIPATFFLTSDYLDNHQLGFRHLLSLIVEKTKKIARQNQRKALKVLFKSYDKNSKDLESQILLLDHSESDFIRKIIDILELDIEEYLSINRPYLESGEVHTLIADGFEIGAHSMNHPMYSKITEKEQVEQTLNSIKAVSSIFGINYAAFAFPFSDFGVKKSFYKKTSHNVDLYFGTSGMMEDPIKSCYQRIWMENCECDAERMVADHYLAKMYRLATRQNVIRRN